MISFSIESKCKLKVSGKARLNKYRVPSTEYRVPSTGLSTNAVQKPSTESTKRHTNLTVVLGILLRGTLRPALRKAVRRIFNRSFTDIKQTQQTNSKNKLKSNQKEIKSYNVDRNRIASCKPQSVIAKPVMPSHRSQRLKKAIRLKVPAHQRTTMFGTARAPLAGSLQSTLGRLVTQVKRQCDGCHITGTVKRVSNREQDVSPTHSNAKRGADNGPPPRPSDKKGSNCGIG